MSLRLTYCGNVHAAADLDEWIAAGEAYSVPVARAVGPGDGPFGLGVWWNAEVAATLRRDEAARERVRAWLTEHGLGIATLNVFPYGDFHGAAVKTAVYEPGWDREERLQYTLDAATVVASMVPPGSQVALSTLPLGYRGPGDGGAGDGGADDGGADDGGWAEDRRRMARNLARCASACAALLDATGVEVVVALEPEPFCLIETVAALREFLEDRVFGAPDAPVSEAVMRRHLGVCVDLCHLEVVGEDPLEAYRELRRAGVAVPKIQVSSCLELRDPAAGLDALLAFDEPRYLHQTVSFDGRLRALDLDEVRVRRAAFAAAEGLRTHFHMPLYWDAPDAALGSTRAGVERFLRGLAADVAADPADAPLLEVETYTWSVLDADWRPDRDLVRGLTDEIRFVQATLADRA